MTMFGSGPTDGGGSRIASRAAAEFGGGDPQTKPNRNDKQVVMLMCAGISAAVGLLLLLAAL